MKRFFLTSLILGLFTFALVGCNSGNTTTGDQTSNNDQVKELDGLMDSVRTDQYADNSLDTLQ